MQIIITYLQLQIYELYNIMAIGKNYFINNYYRLKLKYPDSET